MLPEWEFGTGSDAAKKRHAFIAWVNAELDHLAVITTDRFIDGAEPPEDWFAIVQAMRAKTRDPWRPSLSDEKRAADGMDAAIVDYITIKHIFANYWPKMHRPLEDAASAERIAVRRNWRELREINKSSDWTAGSRPAKDARTDHEIEKAQSLQKAWRQWKKRPGRTIGTDDIAYLRSLRAKRN